MKNEDRNLGLLIWDEIVCCVEDKDEGKTRWLKPCMYSKMVVRWHWRGSSTLKLGPRNMDDAADGIW